MRIFQMRENRVFEKFLYWCSNMRYFLIYGEYVLKVPFL